MVFVTTPIAVPTTYRCESIHIQILWGQHQYLESFAWVIQRCGLVYLTIVFSAHISSVPTCLPSEAWRISFTGLRSLVLPPLPISFYPHLSVSCVCYQASQVLHYLSSLVSAYLPTPSLDRAALLPHSFLHNQRGFLPGETSYQVSRPVAPVATPPGLK